MPFRLSLVGLLLIVAAFTAAPAQSQVLESDSLALVDLYNSTGGPNWERNDNWLTDRVALWHGVTTRCVDYDRGRWGRYCVKRQVLALRLDEIKLIGEIPSSIGNLTDLTKLYLDDNQLTGPIPSAIGNLTNLTRLYLDGNQLSGPIPSSIGNLTNLTRLDLDRNQLTGPIPSWISTLTNLRQLSFSNNQLSGPVPSSFTQLSNLEDLYLNGNELSGLPDLTALPIEWRYGFYVRENRIDIGDLEPYAELIENGFLSYYNLSPQLDSLIVGVALGDRVDVSVQVRGSSNEYSWRPPGDSERTLSGDRLLIDSVTVKDIGQYQVTITSPLLPNVEMEKTIFLQWNDGFVVTSSSNYADPNLEDGICGDFGDGCTLAAAFQNVARPEETRNEIRFSDSFYPSLTIPPPGGIPLFPEGVVVDGRVPYDDGRFGRADLAGASYYETAPLLIENPNVTVRNIDFDRYDFEEGIEITGSDVTIEDSGLGTHIVVGEGAEWVDVQRNNFYYRTDLNEDGEYDRSAITPIDLGGDGPSCFPWSGDSSAPNQGMPPPRLTDITTDGTTTTIRGQSRPEARVVAYLTGYRFSDRRLRYFQGTGSDTSIRIVGQATADADGVFVIEADEDFFRIVATAADADGNTSEMSQVRRPIVFVPGTAGSYLFDGAGERAWVPPLVGTDEARNEAIARLDDSGVTAGGIIERVSAKDGYAASFLGSGLEVYGYRGGSEFVDGPYADGGFPQTLNEPADRIDVWRFPYDWRKSADELADELKTFIDEEVMGRGAPTCEVDIVAHSYGGIVSSLYLKKYPEHSRNSVHRMVTIGTPYLGTPQAFAAHSKGYLFDVDRKNPYNVEGWEIWDVDWGTTISVTEDMPVAYGLMPSETYWDVASNGGAELIPWVDVQGALLGSYNDLERLMGDGFLEGGLARNGSLWAQERSSVHSLVNDWRSWEGPPQIFRFIGDETNTTAVGWNLPVPTGIERLLFNLLSSRTVPGDIYESKYYRHFIQPTFGPGDGTVARASATLGRFAFGGARDHSGVDESPWIEEFETFACEHLDLIKDPACSSSSGYLRIRLRQILHEATRPQEDPQTSTVRTFTQAKSAASATEILYVVASDRIGVVVTDDQGRQTGQVGAGEVAYDVPGIGFSMTELSGALSLSRGETYEISATALGEGPTTVRAVRIRDDGTERRTILYADAELSPGGQLAFSVTPGTTPAEAPLDVDADGNGAFEESAPPQATALSDGLAPALPTPSPSIITEDFDTASALSRTVTVDFPMVGDGSWRWTATESSPWLELSSASGTTPDPVELTLRAEGLSDGVYETTLDLEVELDGLTTNYPIEVKMGVNEEVALPVELAAFSGSLDQDAVQLTWQTASETANAGFYVERHGPSGGWSRLGFVSGAGTTTEAQTYRFRDADLPYAADSLIYRLRQVDLDGTSVVSDEVTLARAAVDELQMLGTFPNPARTRVTLRYALPQQAETGGATLQLFDVLGRQVRQVLVPARAGRHETQLDLSRLASGVYFLRLIADGEVRTQRLTVGR